MSGFDALTGKSNFDISEWMLNQVLQNLNNRRSILAMLCKTAVARKVLKYSWNKKLSISSSYMYRIDALSQFGVSVDACLLVVTLHPKAASEECSVYDGLDELNPNKRFGLRSGKLVANLAAFDEFKNLFGSSPLKWRSGIKHDCSGIMELKPTKMENTYINGLGGSVKLEPDYLYPMLKSSDVAKQARPSRYMLVTQHFIGEDTNSISSKAPLTWDYLESHASKFDLRVSSVYRGRPRFSIFGIGEYSFSMWKVCVSGFYKRLRFFQVGPFHGKPVVLDDTCYFIPCRSNTEARELTALLSSEEAERFFESFIFWDAKRPITSGLLATLDLDALAAKCGSRWRSGEATLGLN